MATPDEGLAAIQQALLALAAKIKTRLAEKAVPGDIDNAIAALKGDVAAEGGTLAKLYQRIVGIEALLRSDDVNLDSIQEIVEYAKANKNLIDGITTGKVNVADVINDLTHADADKPLAAGQGKELKRLLDLLEAEVTGNRAEKNHGHGADAITESANKRFVSDAEKQAWNGKANSSDVGALSGLATTNKANLVAAINEVKSGAGGGMASDLQGNIKYGHNALKGVSAGTKNIVVGDFAGESDTTGNFNIGIGYCALRYNTGGHSNVAIGCEAGFVNTANSNTAVGDRTLRSSTTGGSNTAIGGAALCNNTTGYVNTAVGRDALGSNTTGYANTAVGREALYMKADGNLNTDFYNCSGLGSYARVSGNNQVQLGDSSTTTYVYGTVQNRSDLRDKADVRDTVLGLDFIRRLRPVDYRWDMRDDYLVREEREEAVEVPNPAYVSGGGEPKTLVEMQKRERLVPQERDGSKKRGRYHHGLIAQEVQALIEETGIDFGGFQSHAHARGGGGCDVLSIGYDELIAPLIRAVQEQQAMIEGLRARIAEIESAT